MKLICGHFLLFYLSNDNSIHHTHICIDTHIHRSMTCRGIKQRSLLADPHHHSDYRDRLLTALLTITERSTGSEITLRHTHDYPVQHRYGNCAHKTS